MTTDVHLGWLQHLPISADLIDQPPAAMGPWVIWPLSAPSRPAIICLCRRGFAHFDRRRRVYVLTDRGKRLLARARLGNREGVVGNQAYWLRVALSPRGVR